MFFNHESLNTNLICLFSYELNAIAKALYVKSVLQSLFAFGQRSSLFVSIVVCISHNNDLSAALIFTLVQYFNVLHLSLNVFFLRAISFNSVTLASIKRVQVRDYILKISCNLQYDT